MKMRLAFGFLPYLLVTEKLLDRVQGLSKYCVVWLDPSAKPEELLHEEVHVAAWYIVTLVLLAALCPVLPWWLSIPAAVCVKPLLSDIIGKPWKSFEESFAYARGIACSDNPQEEVEKLSHSKWHINEYGGDFHERARKRMRWFQ